MNTIKTFLLSFAMLLLCFLNIKAQRIPDSLKLKIDVMLKQWDRKDGPGGTVGIVMGDSLVYSQTLGMANLEQPSPIGMESMFYLCSLSKQFTGYAIAWLIDEGKIKQDDDIHLYLPWLKDFGQKITVGNLLHHTSGLRDDIALSALFGLNADGMLTQDLALKIIAGQHSLNFSPGEKYAYSNTNYVLLSEIVKKASGADLKKYMDSVVFRPLGMKDARFVDDPRAVVPLRVSSYGNINNAWMNMGHNIYTLGDGGMFCSTTDMAKWARNFWSNDAKVQRTVKLMSANGRLNDGKKIDYGMGIACDEFMGQRRLIHNGGLAGYRTIIIVFPELRIAVFAFANDQGNDIYNRANDIAKLLLPQVGIRPVGQQQVSADPVAVVLDSAALKKYAGTYIAVTGFRIDLAFRSGGLYAGNTQLKATSPTEFYLDNRPQVRFVMGGDGLSFTGVAGAMPVLLERVGVTPVTEKQLAEYVGTYVSDELSMSVAVRLKDGKLVMEHARLGIAKLTLRGTGHVFTESPLMKHLLVDFDNKGRVTGFTVSDEGTANLFFAKIH